MPIPSGKAVLAVLSATAILLLAACGEVTVGGTQGVPVVGNWKYVGRQSTPADADLNGTLTFTTQSGAQVTGALDFIESDTRGQRRLAGAFAGRTIDSLTVDFDVVLGPNTRRHVGRVNRDSLTGTWIESPASGGAPTAAGTFRAGR